MAAELVHIIGFIFEAFAVMLLAKVLRDKVCSLRGYQVNKLITAKDNVAAATEQAGYLLGVLLGFLGAIVLPSDALGFVSIAEAIAIAGCVSIILQLTADYLSDKLIFRGIDDRKAVLEDENLALAMGKGAVSIATGFVIRGALSDDDATLLACTLWFFIGQFVMVISALIYQKLTPYDDLAEIKSGNVAAALPIAGILIATGIIMEGAVSGTYESFTTDGIALLQYTATCLVMVFILRVFTDRLLLPKTNLKDEIVRDRNVGAGLLEGTSFVMAALIVSFFFT